MAKRTSRRVDPQRAKAERMKRRKRRRLIFGIVCVVLVCLAAVMATTVFFRVSAIEVSGKTRYGKAELIQSSGIQEGDNLFFLPAGNVRKNLSGEYPYLDKIELKRHLPGTLEIAVTECKEVITVELEDGSLYYIDAAGKVLEQVTADKIGTTAHVIGTDAEQLEVGQVVTDADSKKIIAVLDMLKLFNKYDLGQYIRSIDITKSFDVAVGYDNRYTLELGKLDDLEHKIQFLKAILKQKDLPNTGIIDLSDGNEARYRPADQQADVTYDETSEETSEEPAEESYEEDYTDYEETYEDCEQEYTEEATEEDWGYDEPQEYSEEESDGYEQE